MRNDTMSQALRNIERHESRRLGTSNAEAALFFAATLHPGELTPTENHTRLVQSFITLSGGPVVKCQTKRKLTADDLRRIWSH